MLRGKEIKAIFILEERQQQEVDNVVCFLNKCKMQNVLCGSAKMAQPCGFRASNYENLATYYEFLATYYEFLATYYEFLATFNYEKLATYYEFLATYYERKNFFHNSVAFYYEW